MMTVLPWKQRMIGLVMMCVVLVMCLGKYFSMLYYNFVDNNFEVRYMFGTTKY